MPERTVIDRFLQHAASGRLADVRAATVGAAILLMAAGAAPEARGQGLHADPLGECLTAVAAAYVTPATARSDDRSDSLADRIMQRLERGPGQVLVIPFDPGLDRQLGRLHRSLNTIAADEPERFVKIYADTRDARDLARTTSGSETMAELGDQYERGRRLLGMIARERGLIGPETLDRDAAPLTSLVASTLGPRQRFDPKNEVDMINPPPPCRDTGRER